MNTELEITEYHAGAALLTGGAKMIRVVPPEGYGHRCLLVFDDTDGRASNILIQHTRGVLQAPTLEYAKNLDLLKSRIFAVRENRKQGRVVQVVSVAQDRS
jgi:hypothetical protein